MTELSRLIARLQRAIEKKSSYVKSIRHPEWLVKSLQELNDLIGNDRVKDAVATQVTHLIMVKRRALDNPLIREDKVMLHTLLYGVPGVGKTLIGTKLAKIWYSLGFIDESRNHNDKKRELGDYVRDMFEGNANGTGTTSSSMDPAMTIYVIFLLIMILISLISLAWSFYNKHGGYMTIIAFIIFLALVGLVIYIVMAAMNPPPQNMATQANKTKDIKAEKAPVKAKADMPDDDFFIRIISRADVIDQYVGWTAKKVNKLLNDNRGKVLFVDEAYSLINGTHDEFGMEALTTFNLFMSQNPGDIIVIFGGYKDLLESGVFAVQPGLKRRFMWQFECNGYTGPQLFQIFKMQLEKNGWTLSDEDAISALITANMDAFPGQGGDTERMAFFAELEHSRDFISNEQGMKMNVIEPSHVKRGIATLRDNNFQETQGDSNNPLANMMRLMAGKKTQESAPPTKQKPSYVEQGDASKDVQFDLMKMVQENSLNIAHH
jgi:NADH:ubiquinone oxidoreductase subunit 3 (subunit A)